MRAGVAIVTVILIAAVNGCAPSAPPAVPPPPAAPAVSFDGTYQGTIRLTASAVKGATSDWCDTPPTITLVVQNNAFAYVLYHPNVPAGSGFSSSPSFTVNIGPDGSFDAFSPNNQAEMTGSASGSQISGKISGTGCGYAFSAQKS
jgi:galactokinase